jgi:hypothetical protein
LLFADLHQKWQSGELTADEIRLWQQSLWRFTSVGHIGKVNRPKSWQEPVNPLVDSHRIRNPFEQFPLVERPGRRIATGGRYDPRDHAEVEQRS